MNNKFKVVQVGLGPMGCIITSLLLRRENLDLRAAVDIDPSLRGKKLGEILNINIENDIIIQSDLNDILTNEKVDVVIIATSSSLEKVAPTIKMAINSGSNVISICEELSYPYQNYPKLSNELDALAKSNNVTIVGTGINPGYLMDLLPIVVTAPCQEVSSIKVTRMMNSAKRRAPFQKKIGTGLKPDEFHQKIRNREITGHVGLTESIQMIVSALGIEYDEIVEFPPKEVITEEEFTTSYGEKVLKGHVCGLQSKAIAKKGKNDVILLDFIAFAVLLMVQKFHYSVQEVTILFVTNNIINYFLSPIIGREIIRIGERKVLSIEYFSLIIVFLAYAMTSSKLIVALLYILDHIFFNFSIAIRTYFQKISDLRDTAPSMAVGFTINHIAAVFLPAIGGLLWIVDYRIPFIGGAALAMISLIAVQKIKIPG